MQMIITTRMTTTTTMAMIVLNELLPFPVKIRYIYSIKHSKLEFEIKIIREKKVKNLKQKLKA